MSLDHLAKVLNFPPRSAVLAPKGVGASVYARLVKEKIGNVLRRKKGVVVETGILVANPDSDRETQHPIAVVCEFARSVDRDVIALTHLLCWNFCRAPLLIITTPNFVEVYSSYESPIHQSSVTGPPRKTKHGNQPYLTDEFTASTPFACPPPVTRFEIQSDTVSSAEETNAALDALQWVELVTGNFFRREAARFPREQRADRTLLANLQYIRERLHKDGLPYDTIHDLLARTIFIQFLFQREDSEGKTAISPDYLKNLYRSQKFSKPHKNLPDILRTYRDAYEFFRLLNNRFNGDLFPGDKESAWKKEKALVTAAHLRTLADFISGVLDQTSGQGFLWQVYSFDSIPLEFISSIYEEFVSQDQTQSNEEKQLSLKKRDTGVFYTKAHLVDFVLDNVLPWSGTDYNLNILDPSCGSGIFLVKAFQRLVQRWRNHDVQVRQARRKLKKVPIPSAEFLSSLLENNLFGVDIDPHAVRVAAFSLYLAMCDELDPRTLWRKAKFPPLRDRQVVERDFFDDDANNPLFKRLPDLRYDLIIGNAPWGRNTIKKSHAAQVWAKTNGWQTSNNDIGPLFLPKALTIAKPDAVISMIQPALPLLTAQLSTAERFRRRLFLTYKIQEIVNLSDLRFVLFEKAVSPPCIITVSPRPPDDEPILYVCPKKRGTDEDYRQIVIEPMDVNFVYVEEARDKPWIWAALTWGNRRHVSLMDKLLQNPSIEALERDGLLDKRRGIYRSGSGGEELEEILDQRFSSIRISPKMYLSQLMRGRS